MATENQITSYKEVTGEQSDEVAKNILQACDLNLERAIELHFLRSSEDNGENGQMQVDENEDDIEIIEEEESSALVDEDGVRRPIRPVQERLVDQSYDQYYAGPQRQRANPIFEQFRDITTGSSSGLHRYPGDDVRFDASQNRAVRQNRQSRRQKDLAEIFRPPIDIIERSDWDSLLKKAREQNRWILVNLQDASEFACQVLNRDVWSSVTLKEMIKQNLLFWQVYADSPEGRRICSYYQQQNYPAIFILDPRTGELVCEIRGREVNDVITEIFDFCAEYPSFEARDHQFLNTNIPSAAEAPAMPRPSTSAANAIMMNGKRKEPVDQNSPDYQAKRMKKVVNINDDELEAVESKTEVKLKSWQSYVLPSNSEVEEIGLVLRFPTGQRHNLKLNNKCPLNAVFAFISEIDNNMNPADCVLVLLYPKREYSLSHGHLTLGELGFSSQELIHVDKTL